MPFFVYGNNGNDFTSPPFPSDDISILIGISAIGTKFDKAENHGPESQKNRVGSVDQQCRLF